MFLWVEITGAGHAFVSVHMNMTSEFRQQYYDFGDKSASAQGLCAALMETAEESSASSGTSSPYSGGTFGGSLGGHNEK